jgi:hypothetical protein
MEAASDRVAHDSFFLQFHLSFARTDVRRIDLHHQISLLVVTQRVVNMYHLSHPVEIFPFYSSGPPCRRRKICNLVVEIWNLKMLD